MQTMQNDSQIETVTWNHIIMYKLLVLDRNTWNQLGANYLYYIGIFDIIELCANKWL